MNKTYRATVRIDRDEIMGDRATVTVNGARWTTDYQWTDGLANLARRATLALFNVDSIQSVERDTRTMLRAGTVAAFTVTALV